MESTEQLRPPNASQDPITMLGDSVEQGQSASTATSSKARLFNDPDETFNNAAGPEVTPSSLADQPINFEPFNMPDTSSDDVSACSLPDDEKMQDALGNEDAVVSGNENLQSTTNFTQFDAFEPLNMPDTLSDDVSACSLPDYEEMEDAVVSSNGNSQLTTNSTQPDYDGIFGGLVHQPMPAEASTQGKGKDAETDEEIGEFGGRFNDVVEQTSQAIQHIRAETPAGMAQGLNLHDHQKIALAWMKAREDGNEAGGILADDMGLGKTVEVIALIIAHRPQRFKLTRYPHMAGNQRGPIIENSVTLIVAPAPLLRQWENEIKSKTSPSLLVQRFEGTRKNTMSARSICGTDVVLVSYEGLVADFKKMKQGRDSVFFNAHRFKFWRVVLDEGHKAKNRSSLTFHAISSLEANYHWYVSGTPIQNSLEEIFPALSFVKIPFYHDWDNFKALLKIEVADAMRTLHHILKKYILRRKKSQTIEGKAIVELPEKVIEDVYVDFTPDEQNFYDSLQQRTSTLARAYLRTKNLDTAKMKTMLLKLRQSSLHPWLVDFTMGDSLNKVLTEEKLVLNAAYKFLIPQIQRIQDILANRPPFLCEQCNTEEVSIIIPDCGHGLCSKCSPDLDGMITGVREGKRCPIESCKRMYDALDITTLVAFQCAYVKDFRADAWTQGDREKQQKKQELEEKKIDLRREKERRNFLQEEERKQRRTAKGKGKSVNRYNHLEGVELVEHGCFHEYSEYDKAWDRGDFSEPEDGGEGVDRGAEESSSDDDDSGSGSDYVMPPPAKKRLTTELVDSWLPKEPESEEPWEPIYISSDDEGSVQMTEDAAGDEVPPDSDQDVPQVASANTVADVPATDDHHIRAQTLDSDLASIDLNAGNHKGPSQGTDANAGFRSQLRMVQGRKGKHYFQLPQNLLRLQQQASTGVRDSNDRYMQRLVDDGLPPSAKITKLLQILDGLKQESPEDRVIVFSFSTTFLDFIEATFYRCGIENYLRYDGKKSAEQKAAAIRDFMNIGNEIRIFLCSLKAGNVGLNLTSANHVVLMEPDYNPFVEAQAIDRVHRIGQKKRVFVKRLLISGENIEKRVVEIQESKKALVNQLIDDADGLMTATKNNTRLTHKDMRFLLDGSGSSRRGRRSTRPVLEPSSSVAGPSRLIPKPVVSDPRPASLVLAPAVQQPSEHVIPPFRPFAPVDHAPEASNGVQFPGSKGKKRARSV